MTTRRVVPTLAAGLLALSAGVGAAATAHAATPTSTATSPTATCTAEQVSVVLDPGSLGGPTRTLCAAAGGTALDVLRDAGVAYAFAPRFPGMVCTLDGRPDPCNGAPVDAYWSYWHRGDGTWQYSTEGPATYRPDPGSTEGWAFGAGDPPGSTQDERARPTQTVSATRAPQPDGAPSGPPVGVLVAGGVVLVLGAGAALRARHRRSAP